MGDNCVVLLLDILFLDDAKYEYAAREGDGAEEEDGGCC